ncbi:helix-turn-helix transcriptional regulator [Pigmentiphaga aceris]|uniref:Helix-turn-helix transcriptional regulator n=1 Tax=Pigmentiphaga aceris TaxID=1940612 RepID=A0A5C0AXN8_9BURK|nr:helix-turn-helix domain-containing protein [Pigmentiphaga aceris]QEI06324.1 helix-turn-helix transcriptional regulator [Pigmentiphaga aceris]
MSKISDKSGGEVSYLSDIGRAVRARRAELGLSQNQLAHLSGLSRQTLVGLENGRLSDLGVNRVAQLASVLGLEAAPLSTAGRLKKRGLWMAAKTASVSYASELSPETLCEILVAGDVPASFVPHLASLLDEAPVPVVVMAVEEAAALANTPPKAIWLNVAKLAKAVSVHRQVLWS